MFIVRQKLSIVYVRMLLMSLAKANLCSKTPLRGLQSNDVIFSKCV
jgi:hypothetical protein